MLSIAVTKRRDQNQLGEEMVGFVLQRSSHIVSLKEVKAGMQAGTSEQG